MGGAPAPTAAAPGRRAANAAPAAASTVLAAASAVLAAASAVPAATVAPRRRGARTARIEPRGKTNYQVKAVAKAAPARERKPTATTGNRGRGHMASIHVVTAQLNDGHPTRKPRGGYTSVEWQASRIERASQVLAACDPDVLALQGVRERAAGQPFLATILAAGDYQDVIFVPECACPIRRRWCKAGKHGNSRGIALASRYPLGARDVIELPARNPRGNWFGALRGKLGLGPEKPRYAILAQVNTPGRPVLVATAELSPLPSLRELQLQTMDAALHRFAQARGLENLPRVILGDLAMPITRARAALRRSGFSGAAKAPTMPALVPTEQEDHILVTGGQVRHAESALLDISTHRALRANITY